MSERKGGTYKSQRSEVSHSYGEEEPQLERYVCSEGDNWAMSGTEPYFRALEAFGRHNLDVHEGSPSVHLVFEYREPGRKKR